MFNELLGKLVARQDLSTEETQSAFLQITAGTVPPAVLGAFLTALRMKGETAAEVTGAAAVLRQKSLRIDAGASIVLDTCGTGGDDLNTFNISTAAAFVAAAGGVVVAKHGNRAVSSRSGSADVLEALGVNIDAEPAVVEESLREAGIGFLFAPRAHPSMKHAAAVRKELGIRTIFNMLGPLSNPAGATRQLLGVYAPQLTDLYAEVLRRLGTERALIVHGRDGMDEATICAETKVTELNKGLISSYTLNSADYFGEFSDIQDIRGGTPSANAQVISEVFKGQEGPAFNIIILNAGLALYVADKAQTIKDGIALASDLVRGGAAAKKVAALVAVTNS